MDVDASLVRQIADRSASNEVVQKPDRSAGFDDDAARDQFGARVLGAVDRPRFEGADVDERKGSPRNREESKQCCGVSAHSLESSGNESHDIDVGPGCPGERFDPERRAAGPFGDVARCAPVELRCKRRDELQRSGRSERPELQHRFRVEGGGDRRPPCGGEEREAFSRISRCSEQVVAEGERKLVCPLKIVEDDQRRRQLTQSPKRGLQDPERLDWIVAFSLAEDE